LAVRLLLSSRSLSLSSGRLLLTLVHHC
jgi:hypothetical protein